LDNKAMMTPGLCGLQ